jgi:nitroreductase
MRFDLVQTDQLLTTTRSVRRRLDLERPVSREVVLDCVRLSMQAPTASNGQGWRWVVVDDPETRRALGDLYRRMADQHLQRYEVPGATTQTERVLSSARYLAEIIADVPVLVIPCIEGRLAHTAPVLAASFYGSIFPAVWSFQLALRSRGLGTTVTTLHLAEEREAAEILGIPETVTQVALLPVAYTTGEDFQPAARPPVEAITYWNRWPDR